VSRPQGETAGGSSLLDPNNKCLRCKFHNQSSLLSPNNKRLSWRFTTKERKKERKNETEHILCKVGSLA